MQADITLIPAFALSRDERAKALLSYIATVVHQPMTPAEFCHKWVSYPLTDPDYKQACEDALCRATGLAVWEVARWGRHYSKHPAYIPFVLRLADIVRQAQKLGVCKSSTGWWSAESLPLPRGYKKPKFGFDDSVVSEGNFGTIAGLAFLDGEWHYSVKLHPDSPAAAVQPVLQVPQSQLSTW